METCGAVVKNLNDVLSEKQLRQILVQAAKPEAKLVSYDLRWASAGLTGFLGDHLRLTLKVLEESSREIRLFVKSLPRNNQPKADFITQSNFNKREATIYKLFEEMGDVEDPNPWRPKAYIHTEDILVMPDFTAEGYKPYPVAKYFDNNHVMVALTSIARFHAAFANHITKKSVNGSKPYNFLDEYGPIMNEPAYFDTPWLRAGAKLTSNILKEFSTNFKRYPDSLEERLYELYIKACEGLRDYEDTLNVVIHKDLWASNILFRYSGDVATGAIIIDYQCVRFGPPAFDVMLFLFLTTSRKFREIYENEALRHYYSVFSESLDDDTKQRLENLNYDFNEFLGWCRKARFFGMLLTSAIFPYILMEPVRAQETFNDPETFLDLLEKDRSVPVVAHARENGVYKNRQLEISEEIVEEYIMGC